MDVVLKRISKDAWDGLMQSITLEFERTKEVVIDEVAVENAAIPILISGEKVVVDINPSKYVQILESDTYKYEKLAKLGIELHKDFRLSNGAPIAANIMYEKELWAYLSMTVLKEVAILLFPGKGESDDGDLIKRFIFNTNKPSRTGLLYVWTFSDMLDSTDYSFCKVAFKFKDPVNALYERAMSRNPVLLKAFVQGIINNDADGRIGNKKYKSKIPSHISCYSCVNILDVYSYDELVENITEQIKTILSI